MTLLTAFESRTAFNQYLQEDPEFDLAAGAAVRRANLECYLRAFAGARYLLVGEAAGYAGCRFSGIPFTSEAQLVGPGRLVWTGGWNLAQSSRAAAPWSERSASAVWEAIEPRCDCLLWNAFPWHPFGPAGPLSNRPPRKEVDAGLEVLRCVLALFPSARPVAVGRVAQRALAECGVEAPYVRHPSHGGKQAFLEGVRSLEAGCGPREARARPDVPGEVKAAAAGELHSAPECQAVGSSQHG